MADDTVRRPRVPSKDSIQVTEVEMTGASVKPRWTRLSICTLLVMASSVLPSTVLSSEANGFPENHGKVNTALFIGEGSNQPLIVGLGGAEGGNAWAGSYWATQREEFISKGYAFLAVGYFGMEGIPHELDRIALEGVHQVIVEASKDPRINQQCIALIGGSKGAELALLLASKYDDIKAVVAMAPGNAVFAAHTAAMDTPSFSFEGKPLEFVPVPESAIPALIRRDLRAAWVEMSKDQAAVERAAIEVEKINGPIFFVSANRDEFWPSTEMSQSMEQRLSENNFPYHVEHLTVPGDHASVLNRFDEIELFLDRNLMQRRATGCSI